MGKDTFCKHSKKFYQETAMHQKLSEMSLSVRLLFTHFKFLPKKNSLLASPHFISGQPVKKVYLK